MIRSGRDGVFRPPTTPCAGGWNKHARNEYTYRPTGGRRSRSRTSDSVCCGTTCWVYSFSSIFLCLYMPQIAVFRRVSEDYTAFLLLGRMAAEKEAGGKKCRYQDAHRPPYGPCHDA